MLEQTLYDKVISVTLYRKAKEAPALYKTIAPASVSETKVNGRRVLRECIGFPLHVFFYIVLRIALLPEQHLQTHHDSCPGKIQ